jgi:hypothetical protein
VCDGFSGRMSARPCDVAIASRLTNFGIVWIVNTKIVAQVLKLCASGLVLLG